LAYSASPSVCFESPGRFIFQQTAKLQQRGANGHSFAPEIYTHEAPQGRAVRQGFFTGLIGQIEPMLHEEGTISSIVARNASRLVGLLYCSNPAP
jgi:hypothetical protein